MSIGIPVITDHNDEFEIHAHVDDSATTLETQESWSSVDVKGGWWVYKGNLIKILGATDIGSVATPYIVVTINPYDMSGLITAEAAEPKVEHYSYKRLIGKLNFITDTPAALNEYPKSPPWNGEQVIQNWDQHIRSTQYTSGRWTVYANESGDLYCSEGTWYRNGEDKEWADGPIHKINTIGKTATPISVSSLAAGTYNVIAAWHGSDYGTEPIVDNADNSELFVGLASSVYSSGIGINKGFTADRNWELLAVIKVTTTGNIDSIETVQDDDIYTNVHSNDQEAIAWRSSGYFTWGSYAGNVPNRALIQKNPINAPERGMWQIGNEHTQPDYSENIFIGNTDGNSTGDILQGPDGSGLWAAIDSAYASIYTQRDQSTLETRLDGTAVGNPYLYYQFGLFGIDTIPIVNTPERVATYFLTDGNDTEEVIGKLVWTAFDNEWPLRPAGYSRSIQVLADEDIIQLYYFDTSKKHQCPTRDSLSTSNDRALEWIWPVTWNNKGGDVEGNPAGLDLWTNVPQQVSIEDSGATLRFKLANAEWAGGTSNFAQPAGGFIDFTPGTAGFACSAIDDCCSNVMGCIDCNELETNCHFVTDDDGGGGEGTICQAVRECLDNGWLTIEHDGDLSESVTPCSGCLVNEGGHDGRYWRTENYGGTDQNDNFSCVGYVKAVDFYIQDALTNHWGNDTFVVDVTGLVNIQADTGATLGSSGGQTVVENGGTGIWINAYANPVDIDGGNITIDGSGYIIGNAPDIQFRAITAGLYIESSHATLYYNAANAYFDTHATATEMAHPTLSKVTSGGAIEITAAAATTILSGVGANLDIYQGSVGSGMGLHFGSLASLESTNEVEIVAGSFINLNPTSDLKINGTSGTSSATFTTVDGKTVTVTKGIITSVV